MKLRKATFCQAPGPGLDLQIIQYRNGQIYFGTIRNFTHVALLEPVAFDFSSARCNMASVQKLSLHFLT